MQRQGMLFSMEASTQYSPTHIFCVYTSFMIIMSVLCDNPFILADAESCNVFLFYNIFGKINYKQDLKIQKLECWYVYCVCAGEHRKTIPCHLYCIHQF